jgi:hypothetical protein
MANIIRQLLGEVESPIQDEQAYSKQLFELVKSYSEVAQQYYRTEEKTTGKGNKKKTIKQTILPSRPARSICLLKAE